MIEQMTIQEILDKYESFKLKWFQMTENDLFERLKLQDVIQDKIIELKSEYLESKLEFDRDYWMRIVELKDMKDSDWKKMFTDTTAKAKADEQFFEKECSLIQLKLEYENLLNKSNNIIEYINIIKLSIKKDFTI